MSSCVDFAVFSMKSVSLGAIPSNTTLRMLDLPPLERRKEGCQRQNQRRKTTRIKREGAASFLATPQIGLVRQREEKHLLGPINSTLGFLLPLVSTSPVSPPICGTTMPTLAPYPYCCPFAPSGGPEEVEAIREEDCSERLMMRGRRGKEREGVRLAEGIEEGAGTRMDVPAWSLVEVSRRS